MKIEAYSFGSMTIEGKVYENDLIVFPDKIRSNWWRTQGHILLIEDLTEVINYKPLTLVVGTGAAGAMQIPESTKKSLKEANIELLAMVTEKAYQAFNEQIQAGKKVVAAFHLTC